MLVDNYFHYILYAVIIAGTIWVLKSPRKDDKKKDEKKDDN